MTELFGQFESEHIFTKDLFKDPNVAAVLNRLGYTKDMAGNRIALFNNPEIVAQIEALPESHPMRQLLVRSGWGPVLHRSGDTSIDGFQTAKRAFEKSKINEWIRRSKLEPTSSEYISEEGLKAAIDDLHQFERSVALGEVRVNELRWNYGDSLLNYRSRLRLPHVDKGDTEYGVPSALVEEDTANGSPAPHCAARRSASCDAAGQSAGPGVFWR